MFLGGLMVIQWEPGTMPLKRIDGPGTILGLLSQKVYGPNVVDHLVRKVRVV